MPCNNLHYVHRTAFKNTAATTTIKKCSSSSNNDAETENNCYRLPGSAPDAMKGVLHGMF
jgi:hypothetical protein